MAATRVRIRSLTAGLAVVTFALDAAVPRGFAIGVVYVVVVAMTVLTESELDTVVTAIASSVLAIGAALFGQVFAAPTRVMWVNRGLALLAVWTVALLVIVASRLREQRARSEQRERRSAALLDRAMELSPDGLLVIDSGGAIRASNAAAHRIFGYGPGELIATSVERLLPADRRRDHAAHRATYLASPAVRPMSTAHEVAGVRRDGIEVPLEVTLAPAGADGLVVAAIRDVSERRRADERRRAAQRLEAIGRLAGGIAHDFNNLLAVILSCGQFLRKSLGSSSAYAADVEDILAATRRGSELTRQLLTFSRRQAISPRRIDANALVVDFEKMLRRIVGDDVELVIMPGDAWTVEIDPSQLEQVILNLAVNARDAMPDGGKLTIETGRAALDTVYASEHPDVEAGEYVLLAISDTGVGMTDEVRQRAFEPFFTTKLAGVGTGMGLATVYGIVKQAGGHVWIYSEPGRGTTFKVYLPRARGAPEQVAVRRESTCPRGGSETVLVVEDEPGVRRVRALPDSDAT